MKRSLLITGPARSGKTAHCLRVYREAVRKCKPGRVVYIAPSGETAWDIERELLLGGERGGILGPVVTDFTRIAVRILKESGYSSLRRIGPLERLYLILEAVKKTPLTFFKSVKNSIGFADALSSFIAELKRAMIPPEVFLRGCLSAAGRGPIDNQKVRELHAIYLAYHETLRAREAYDGEGLLWTAAEALAHDPSILSPVEVLLVDGFATYTPAEFEILRQLVNRVKESHVTLCYEQERQQVFDFVEATCRRLKKMCGGREKVLSRNLLAFRPLLHMERNLFGAQSAPVSRETAIAVVPTSDPRREVETVARKIETIRSDERLEYGDFMVILRNLGDYSQHITEVFAERGIPFSLPAMPSLSERPFVRAMMSALRLIKGEFRADPTLAMLKNSYLSGDRDAAAAVENYVNEFGLWNEDELRQTWADASENAPDVEFLNAFKAQCFQMLDRLRSEAMELSSAEQFRKLVFSLTRELLAAGGGQPAQKNYDEMASLLRREGPSLGAIASLLDVICEFTRLRKSASGDYGDFLEMLERGVTRSAMLSTARHLNSVRITSIAGGTPPAARVVFICGLCERSFPKEIVSEPFFKDRERWLINREGKIILDERLPLSSGERFFFYIATSRATQKLILTYPAADCSGQELVPSHYVEEVVRLFSDLKVAPENEGPGLKAVPEFKDLADARELQFFVANHLSRPAEEKDNKASDEGPFLAVLAYNLMTAAGQTEPEYFIFPDASGEQKLPQNLCQDLMAKGEYFTSVSELETFGQCPFRHFCEHRLRLKESPRYEFGPPEEGILYHDVLARLYRDVYPPAHQQHDRSHDTAFPPPRGLESLSPEELAERLGLLLDDFIAAGYTRLFRTPRIEVRRRAMLARITHFLLKEVENERANATRPIYFELSFGPGKSGETADNRSTSAPLRLASEDGPSVHISGRMDRVDILEAAGERLGIVVDYKRSGRRSRADLARGKLLQPGIYMLALRELFGLKPAAAFYYSISSGRKRGIFAAEEEDRIAGRGDVSRTDRASYKEIDELIELNSAQGIQYARRITEGDITIDPADTRECRNCPFVSVCRIVQRVHQA